MPDREAMVAAFDYANASLALEGLAVDQAQAERQQRVIRGELSIAQAIAQASSELGHSQSV